MLRVRDFRLFYTGYCTSLVGSAMSSVAIAFALLGDGGTATGLGLVFTANIVPMVALMLFGGALADRLGRRPVMLAADLARCAAQAVLAAGLTIPVIRHQPWPAPNPPTPTPAPSTAVSSWVLSCCDARVRGILVR